MRKHLLSILPPGGIEALYQTCGVSEKHGVARRASHHAAGDGVEKDYKHLMMMMMTVTQHIPTMTKSHHGGEMSVMMKVGMCQCQKPTIHHTP